MNVASDGQLSTLDATKSDSTLITAGDPFYVNVIRV